jgi:predicted nucleic acid-binding protein
MRIALDSNIAIYLARIARSPADVGKINAALGIVSTLKNVAEIAVPVQTLGELYGAAKRSGLTAVEARTIMLEFVEGALNPSSTATAMLAALDLATDHRLQLWEALILCAAAEAGCAPRQQLTLRRRDWRR